MNDKSRSTHVFLGETAAPSAPAREIDKIADLQRDDLTYERRVVAFYDVLGWKNHIESAGTTRFEISRLRRLIVKTVRTARMDRGLELRVSTFSDNVVITQRPGANTPQFLQQLAIWQLGAAINGFAFRGGITVGDINHEDEAVFGPGLVRAHYLESKVAVFPRIVLDPLVMAEFGELGSLCATEDGVTFLDPFRLRFCEHLRGATYATAEELKKAGLNQPKGVYSQLSNETILSQVTDSLSAQMKQPMKEMDFRKAAWLYDRVANQVGWPLSNTYKRVPA